MQPAQIDTQGCLVFNAQGYLIRPAVGCPDSPGKTRMCSVKVKGTSCEGYNKTEFYYSLTVERPFYVDNLESQISRLTQNWELG